MELIRHTKSIVAILIGLWVSTAAAVEVDDAIRPYERTSAVSYTHLTLPTKA